MIQPLSSWKERKRTEQALREREEQWREIFEHNPVMYFMVSPTGTVLSVNGFGAAQLGYTAAELVGQSVLNVFFEEDHEAVKDQLATCVQEPGSSHSWEIRKIRKDGTLLWVRENAKAVQRSRNDVVVWIACEDITERRRGERRVAGAYAVTSILAEADSLAAAGPDILRAIGGNLEWDWGALWIFDRERAHEDAPLRCDCLWHAPDIDSAEFDAISRRRAPRAWEGRLGQVWRSASPSWIVDAPSEPGFLRAAAASRAGLRGGVIFPIMLDTEALGVVEFFSREARERDEEQLATLSAIGSQIGQFIKRRSAEAALRASEERWRKLFESSAAGMALSRLDGVFTAANPALQRMLGRTEEEIVGHSFLELNPEEERAATAEALAKFRGGSLTERQVEKKYLRKDGNPVWLDITTTLVPATETTGPFLQAVYMDITDRVHFEAALRASEERWRRMFETSAAGMATAHLDGGFTAANPALQRMLDRTEDEILGRTAMEITHEDERVETENVVARFRSGLQQEYHVEKRYLKKNGSPVWLNVTTTLVPATETADPFLQAIYINITDRKRTEAALRASEERWRAMFETAPVGITMLDFEHRRYLAANAVFQRMTGYTEDELRQLTALDLTHEDDRGAAQTRINAGVIGGQQKRYRRKDGGVIWADVSAFVVLATDSTPTFLGAVVVDITDRKRAEAALRASEERWRTVFEAAAVGIATTDLDHRYVTANETYQRMTGYTEGELQNLTPEEITYGDDLAATRRFLDGIFTGLHRSYRIEKRYRRKDGEVVWADVNPFFVPATEGTPALCAAFVVDITERKRAEEALQQAQADLARLNRVMLLEEMAASIAHEVNQPIAAVITNANAGLRWLGARQPDLDEVRQTLARIVRDGTRAGEVTSRIRGLVKKMPPRRELSDINETIRDAIALTQTEMQRNGVRWHSRLAVELPLVSADRVQLQQVLINLIVNAVEAMAGIGEAPRELTIVSDIIDRDGLLIEVQDTGPGFDPEKLDRFFQSFYTTKPEGVGMGLAISRSIVEAHGGRLSAAQNQPRGAVFRFTLPVE
jgi:PAS domain S-box-containing protein